MSKDNSKKQRSSRRSSGLRKHRGVRLTAVQKVLLGGGALVNIKAREGR